MNEDLRIQTQTYVFLGSVKRNYAVKVSINNLMMLVSRVHYPRLGFGVESSIKVSPGCLAKEDIEKTNMEGMIFSIFVPARNNAGGKDRKTNIWRKVSATESLAGQLLDMHIPNALFDSTFSARKQSRKLSGEGKKYKLT